MLYLHYSHTVCTCAFSTNAGTRLSLFAECVSARYYVVLMCLQCNFLFEFEMSRVAQRLPVIGIWYCYSFYCTVALSTDYYTVGI